MLHLVFYSPRTLTNKIFTNVNCRGPLQAAREGSQIHPLIVSIWMNILARSLLRSVLGDHSQKWNEYHSDSAQAILIKINYIQSVNLCLNTEEEDDNSLVERSIVNPSKTTSRRVWRAADSRHMLLQRPMSSAIVPAVSHLQLKWIECTPWYVEMKMCLNSYLVNISKPLFIE